MAASPSRTIRWLRRILVGLAGLVVLAVAAGSIWEAIAWRSTVANYPPPGRMIDVAGRKMLLLCRGTGSPTVVLEAGLDVGGIIGWSLVQDSIARTTHTCAYNRAGIVWSEPSPGPHNAITIAADLHALLAAAGEKPPYVMVGHSLGGPYIMTYTKYHGGDVAGLVFVDASHPDQVKRMAAVIGKMPDASLRIFNIAAALSWTGIVRLMSSKVTLPKLPPDRVAAMQGYLPRSLGGELQEAAGMDATFAEAGSFRNLGDRPLVVLTSMAPLDTTAVKTLKLTPEKAKAYKEEWRIMHDEEASWSSTSRHELVHDATHYIQIDRPDVVIRAVREVVDSVRARRP